MARQLKGRYPWSFSREFADSEASKAAFRAARSLDSRKRRFELPQDWQD